jgi:hypothetical protein
MTFTPKLVHGARASQSRDLSEITLEPLPEATDWTTWLDGARPC